MALALALAVLLAKSQTENENGPEIGNETGNGPETSQRHALHAELVRGADPNETPKNRWKGFKLQVKYKIK